MQFQILIDGYNLLFTGGFEGRSRQRGWLGQGRQRLIKHLETHLAPAEIGKTLVVFDVSADVMKDRDRELDSATGVSPMNPGSGGIQVAFAFGFDEADDMLENLIRKHSSPKSLTVVSSDHRIRKCAIARRAISIDSDAFLNRLERPDVDLHAVSQSASEFIDDKPGRDGLKLSESEVQQWLREFGEDFTN